MKVNNKDKIIAVATKLFEELPYDKVSVDRIIEESNTSKGTFYHYFKSKDDLLIHYAYKYDERFKEFVENLSENINSIEKIKRYIEFYFNSVFKDYIGITGYSLLKKMYINLLSEKSPSKDYMLNKERYSYTTLAKLVEEGKDKGEILKDIDTEEIMDSLYLLLRGSIYHWFNKKNDEVIKIGSNLVDLYLKSISK